ncbi:hypothetical protein GM921_11875 [Pedobacter sp. LMG 31464]|uniref:Uncharacterized protein n=1 Tax=Pedobacter planticolens TaxID=2679964 RepID=A0A923IVT0_9SPHI|nr:hypothetical protein [Pedobacter planticolens]MBB2146188.1 hypothetical protein [Pedobacter planticolens]
MNTIEEQLWNYIDGNCTAEEKIEIETKIAVNIQYHSIYQELLVVHNELNKIDFEEPSMSFTRNVMDKVNLELKPVALKTKIDNRIIYSIGGFFALSMLSIFIYALATSNLTFDFKMPAMNFNVGKYINPTTIQLFLLVDVALGLLYLDSFLRKRKISAQKKGD